MKLKEFTLSTVGQIVIGAPAIRFTSSGIIYINAPGVAFMNGIKKKQIALMQDEERPKDWYLAEQDGGFVLRQYKQDNVLSFSSKPLVELVRTSIKCDKKAFGLKILEKTVLDGKMVYPLLTSTTI